MAEPQKTGQSTETGNTGGLTLGELGTFITDKVKEALGTAKEGEQTAQAGAQKREETKLDRPTNIANEVQAELAKIREHEAKEAKENELHGKVAAIEEKVKEKPPIERGKMHKFMGWGE